MAFVIWGVLSVVVAFFCMALHEGLIGNIPKSSHAKVLKIAIITLTVIVVISPAYYEFPNPGGNSQVLTFNDDGSVNNHPFGIFAWDGSDSYVNMPITATNVYSRVSPVTENPKVRRLRYEVAVRIENPVVFYSVIERRTLPAAEYDNGVAAKYEIRKLTEYWLYEFNEKNSIALGKFYNPRKDDQNDKLKEMIESWVNPKLKKDGLALEFKRFDL